MLDQTNHHQAEHASWFILVVMRTNWERLLCIQPAGG
jgi:hypothetical protein